MVRRAVWMSLLLVGFGLTGGVHDVRADYTAWQSVDLYKPADPTTEVGKPTNWDTTATFNQFNAPTLPPPPGTETYELVGAQLKLDYQFENQISMRFDNVATITVSVQGTLNLDFPESTTPIVPTATFTNSETLTSSPSDVFSHVVNFPVAYIPSSPGEQTSTVTSLAQLATYFTGAGTVNLPVSATATSSFNSNSANGFGSSMTQAWATVSIRYIYIAVPEPSSFVLTGLGLTGLVGAATHARRSRAKRL